MAPRFWSLTRLLGLSALLMGLSVACDGSGSGPTPPPVQPPHVNAEKSSLEVSRAQDVLADGADSVTVTVTVRDSDGAPMANKVVNLSVAGEGATLKPADVRTDTSGVAKSVLTATVDGTKTLKASVQDTGGPVALAAQPTVAFRPVAATKLVFLTAQLSATAGAPVAPAIEVAIQNAQGHTVGGATNEVTLALGAHPDGAALDGTVTARAVNGVARFPEVVLKKAGTGYTLVASATGLESATSAAFDVSASAASSLRLSLSASSVTAGQGVDATVELVDGLGNVATGYTGTVAFSASDASAALPADYSFTAVDAGRHTFHGLVFTRAGAATLTVTDKAAATLSASGNLSVLAGAAAKLAFTQQPASTSVRKTLGTVQVALQDAFGNKVAVNAPAVTVALLGGASASLDGVTSVAPADGVASFTTLAVAEEGAGYKLTASAAGLTGATSSAFDVLDDVAPAVAVLREVGSTTSTIDVAWNEVGDDGVLGTASAYEVRYASTDITTDAAFAAATLVKSGTPQAPGAVETATLTGLTQGGTYFVAVKVTDNAGNSSRSAALAVSTQNPQVAKLVFSQQPVDGTAGVALADIRVSLLDASDAVLTSATSAVTLTLKQDATVTKTVSAVNGVATFSGIVINTSGASYTFEATSGSLAVTSAPFAIQAGAAKSLSLVGLVGPLQAGTASAVEVSVRDAFGNLAAGYTGTVHFTSSDSAAVLPADYTFTGTDGGKHAFSVTLKSTGNQSVTVTDVADSALTDSRSVDVGSDAVDRLVIEGFPNTVTAGAAAGFYVAARDRFGNLVTGYTGTVHFISTDSAAVVPGDVAFTSTDAGRKQFSATFKTAGGASLTVVDLEFSALTHTVNTTVNAGPAKRLVLSAPAQATAGGPFSVTVTARDGFGNTATGYTGTVHFDSDDTHAVLPADTAFASGDSGRKTFASVELRSAGQKRLGVTDTADSALTDSASVDVSAAAPQKLVFTTQPVSGRVRAELSPVRVALVDAYDNDTLADSPSVTLSLNGTATLGGTTTQVPSSGTASFSNLTVDNEGTGYTLTATAGSLTPATTTAFDIVDDVPPAKPVLAEGAVSATTIAVEWNEVGDDGVDGRATGYEVRYSTSDITTDAQFAAATLVKSGVPADPGTREQVTLTGLQPSTTYYVAVRVTDSAGNTARSDALMVSTQDAQVAAIEFTQQPADSTAGVALADIQVKLVDASGATVTTSSAAVTLTLSADSSVTETVAADHGIATFSGIVINKAGTNYTFRATSGTAPAATSASFSIRPAPVAALQLTGWPATVSAGSEHTLTVTARDALGNVATDYTGTVHFAASDDKAVLPADAVFSAGDLGVKTFDHVSLHTVGNHTVTVTDTGTPALTQLVNVDVIPGAAAGFVILAPVSSTAGDVISVSITAHDAYGNVATGYTGTVHVSSTDTQAVLPADHTFTADEEGQHTFSVTLRTAGSPEVKLQDTADAALVVSQQVDVAASYATHLALSAGAGPYEPDAPFSLSVTARDAYENAVMDYTGTVHFTSTDGAASLPADYAFTAADKGTHAFANVVLRTAGTQSIQAVDTTDDTVTGTFSTTVLAPTSATSLAFTGSPGPFTAGQPTIVEVVAYTASLDVATTYTGTVHFTSTDASAVLPSDYTFTAADAGRHSFPMIFKAAGTVTLAVTDTVNAALAQNLSAQVNPDAPAKLSFTTEPANGTVRTALSTVRVALVDAYGNRTTASAPNVQLALKGGTASAVLGGTTSAAPVNGEASFSTLTVDLDGTGFQLTATGSALTSVDSAAFDIVDNVAPSAAPLTVTSQTVTSVTLGWTATGDDGSLGTASAYDLRYSTSAITTDAQFAAATPFSIAAPKASGSAETATVTGLNAATTYFFALKVRDSTGNASTLTSVSGTTVDPCSGFTCAPSTTPATCAADGISRVTYASACVVQNNAATCVDKATTTACTGTNAVCYAAACTTAAAPAAGELFISEVMKNPSVGTTEYVELINPTQKLLNINGLKVSFTDGAGTQSVTVNVGTGNALVIGKAGTLVLAQVKDKTANGGVPADYEYGTGFDIGNVGTLAIASGATTLDSVAYDLSFPQTPGKAMNLSSAVVGSSGSKYPWYWCDSTAQLSGNDYGSPNAANDACGMAVTPPVDYCRIQFPKTIASMNAGDNVTVYTQFYEPSVTDRKQGANDFYPYVVAELGYGTDAANPSSWAWTVASFNTGYSNGTANDDELQANLGIGSAGNYFYGFRYRLMDPVTGTASTDVYCDQNGVASNFSAAAWGTVTVVGSVTNHIVISEFSGGNGTGSAATDEFIELYNPTSSAVDLSNWKVQYKSATGTAYSSTVNIPSGKSIAAHGYFLLVGANYSQGATAPADVTYTFDTSSSTTAGGHVRVGPSGLSTNVVDPLTVDKLGWGTGNSPEGAAAPSHPAVGGSLERKAKSTSTSATMAIGGADEKAGNGVDTDDNSKDFVTRAVRQPQSSASPTEP